MADKVKKSIVKDVSKDRRTRRTHRLLKQGLAELLSERDFSEISVRDIAERADVNRSTFYLHYSDTFDLLQKLEADTLNDIVEMIDAHRFETEKSNSLIPIFEPILDYIVENEKIFRSLFENKSSSNFTNKVMQLVFEKGMEMLKSVYPESDINNNNARYIFEYVTFGLIGIIKEWIDSGMKKEKTYIINLANTLATSSFANLSVSDFSGSEKIVSPKAG